jgi:hypothetical protein
MKRVFISAALLLTSTLSFAQQNRISLGVEGGISLANLAVNNTGYQDIYESRTGYAAGLAFQYNFPKVFSFHTGLMYELRGATFPDSATTAANPSSTAEWLETLDYLTVPLLLRATFGDKINFFVNGGPYWALLLKRKQVLEAAANYPEQEIDLTSQTERTEWGIAIGAGASAVFNERIVISLEARDNIGMEDIAPQSYVLKTRTFLILAGVAFKFGSRENDVK